MTRKKGNRNRKQRVFWFDFKSNGVTVPVYLADCGNVLGRFRSDEELCVEIDWGLPPDMAESTVLHEMGHASLFLAGVNFLRTKKEERVVNPLTAVLYGTLRDAGFLTLPPRPELP